MFIDFHTHILPGIDDGSASVEESIELLKKEAEQGITRVVATPHFYAQHDTPEEFLERRNKAFIELSEEMKKYSGLPEITLGAEVYYYRGIADSEALDLLTLNGKRFILIEMPMTEWTESMYQEIEAIYRRRGITPIMAHMDRYISPFATHKIPEKFAKLPVLVQANASFFQKGGFTSNLAFRLLKVDKIQLLGSDCHNMTTRVPNLSGAIEAIEKKFGKEMIERINKYGETVLN
ncbi:MAG: capsular polysaccharide biosynthesis protein [Oscillospiraceae bacterium]|nr:capsular polysaccharide biosynthesis protein [Oscillospiraceae bacterium]